MRALVLVLFAGGCRLAFEDLGRAATLDGQPGTDDGAAADDDAGVTSGIRAVQATPVLSVDAFELPDVRFPGPTTPGNSIVVYQWSWSSQGSSLLAPSDSAGNTYVSVHVGYRGPTTCAGGAGAVAVHVASAITGGADHEVTLNRNADNTQQYALVAVEYAGLSDDPIVDSEVGLGNNDSPLTFATGPVTTTAPDTLLVSIATVCGGFPNPVSWAAPDLAIRGVELRTASFAPGAAGDRIAAEPGVFSQSWTVTFDDNAVPAFGVIAALR